MNKSNIVLIGMPGSGKSTCGVLAAKGLLKNFYDTDLLIQNREDLRLQEIITSKGNEYFKKAEEDAILTLELEGTVISTGGSVIYSDKAMEHLHKMGKIIFLHIDFDTMMNRIHNVTTRGVVMNEGNSFKDMYEERLPLYNKWADAVISCDNNSVEDTVRAILRIAER